MYQTSRRTCSILLTLCLCFGLHAQMESRLSYLRFTTQDGLSQMQTERVWQDSRGYIYVGTLSGLSRYDGRTMTPLLRGKHENIVGFQETDGQVWALNFRRRWLIGPDEVKMEQMDVKHQWLLNNLNALDLPNGYVLMEDDNEKHRWIGVLEPSGRGHATAGQARTLTDGRMCIEQLMESDLLDLMTPDRKLCVDSSQLYVPTAEGLFRLNMPERVPSTVAAVSISANEMVYTLCRRGSTLYAFAHDGIYTVDGDSLSLLLPYSEWQPDYGFIVRPSRDGTLFVADAHSVYVFDGCQLQQIATGANLIRDMLVDCWERLWVATYQGVYCFFNHRFTNHRLDDKNDIVRIVAIVDGTQPVMGTLNGKVLAGSHIIYDDADDFFLPSAATIGDSIYLAGRNDVACISGTEDSDRQDSQLRWLGLPFERYQFVSEANGRLIIGTRQLVVAYDPATARLDTLSTDILHPWCAAADGEGRLWVGSSLGLFSLSGHKSTYWGFRGQQVVTTMEADERGAVFFASGDSVFVIRQGEIRELNSQLPDLQGHEVRTLHVSSRGFLVVAVIDGLFVARIDRDYRVSDACFYDHRNGFTTVEPQKSRMAEDSTGVVWLCGLEQMVSFRPDELVADGQADTVVRQPLRWYEHWWTWVAAALLMLLTTGWLVQWIEKRRSRRKMLRLQRQKQEREELIRTIREEAVRAERSKLAVDIVRMVDKPEIQRLTLRTVKGKLVVDTSAIVYMKADGNYTQVVTFEDSELVLTGLGALERQLDDGIFLRADRSTLVNMGYIYKLNAVERRCTFRAADGTLMEIPLLAPAFKRLEKLL